MAGGSSFAGELAAHLVARYAGRLSQVVVFVPTSRVAAQVRAALSREILGVLPAVLPLKGNGELADLLGFEMGGVVAAPHAMVEIRDVLVRRAGEDGVLEAAKGERLWRRVDGLYRMLDRLALHGISASDLRRTVPPSMVGLWELQAATLLAVAHHMEHWLARRGEMLPGTAERRVLAQAAQVLGQDDCAWIPVVAGVLDGIPAALDVMKVAQAKGEVIYPSLGPVTDTLAGEMETLLGAPGMRLAGSESPMAEAVAATDWDEAWLAALAVRRAKDAGRAVVGVVSPNRALLQRVAGILAQWNLTVPVRGAMCLDQTPQGREVLGQSGWGLLGGSAADWLQTLRGREVAEEILTALEPLRGIDAWLDRDDWQSLMALTLAASPAPQGVVSEGILLLGPLDARLFAMDTVIAAGAVEGMWPGSGTDAWLSEAHLRALGLPDSARTAQLAGTEFESAVAGGHGEVLVLRGLTQDGRETVPSRFLQPYNGRLTTDRALNDVLALLRGEDIMHGELGVWQPEGKLWPKTWSASFIEALLECPYKALGDRVLRLKELDPLTPAPDARMAGLLVHGWLERAGKEFPHITEENRKDAEARLLELAELELRHEPPVVKAIWRAKFKKLAPALVAEWLANGRTVTALEKRVAKDVGHVTVTAKLDRMDDGVIIDFKTGTPPSWSDVAAGVRPQLAIEAWLMGQEQAVADVEYWQLKGYGSSPLRVMRPGGRSPSLDKIVEPVAEGLAQLEATFREGAPFPAVPDMAGGGLMATGHCARCALAGVCRRKEAGVV